MFKKWNVFLQLNSIQKSKIVSMCFRQGFINFEIKIKIFNSNYSVNQPVIVSVNVIRMTQA